MQIGRVESLSEQDSILSFDGAVKDYGSKVIGPITFSVNRREIVGLLGPNGSGKSTSIRLALGLMRPSSGRVTLMGLDPLREHVRALREVGYSPELPNLQTFMTPSEILRLVGHELGLGRAEIEKQIPTLLDEVGLVNYADYKIGRLSKGMVQRLSVAQSMMGSPSLLILDEPMIGIDPAGVVHFRSVFRRFVERGGTIIMSSHIMSEVEELCNSVAVIHSGRLMFRGDIREFVGNTLDSRVIEVEVSSIPTGLAASLEGIEGVVGVTPLPSGFSVNVRKGMDVRAEVSSTVVRSGAGLLRIGYSRSEFDEAYIATIRGAREAGS